MSAPLEIRNSASSMTFQAIAPFIGAATAGVLALRALSSDTARGPVFLLILFAVGCLGWGLFKASSGFDTAVQVTLDAKGFRDRRAGDVLVPWEKVRSVRSVPGRMGRVVMLALMLPFDEKACAWKSPRSTCIATVRHFAPRVVVDG